MKARRTIKAFSIAFVLCITTALTCSAQLTTLHSFAGADGAHPYAGLLLSSDGNYYGTTVQGGAHESGSVFKITPSGTLTTLHSFNGSDGLTPYAGLVLGNDGNFYGTTNNGGYHSIGEVFKITPGGTLSILHAFNYNYGDGGYPGGLVLGRDGSFYGTTSLGGYQNKGTFFVVSPDGSTFATLYGFESSMGNNPTAALVLGSDGNFYGTAPAGGANASGTVFKITPGGTPTLLYSFCSQPNCTDGASPSSSLLLASDGNFYGTTYGGGDYQFGAVFKITPSGAVTKLHSFDRIDGRNPLGALIQAHDGNFYGTTAAGGTHDVGTIFQMTPAGVLTSLYSFNTSDGSNPNSGLVQGNDGKFYGTTNNGGANNDGTVFKFELTTYTLTVSTSGNGVVTSTDGFISCPGTCSHSYPAQTQITLNATPATGWAFTGWSGACSGTGSCQVTMTQNTNVSATFYQLPVTLTVSVAGDGSVTSADGFINCPGTCSHIYQPNTPVTLNASPAQNWIFSGWTGACSGVGSCNLTMTQNLAVTAVFLEPGHGIQFTPVTPCRLVDTRQTHDPIQGGTSQSYILPQLGGCGIPTSAAAYSLNVTVVPSTKLGYLTIWPTGEAQPGVSTMNSPDGRTKANAAIVPAGTGGAVSIYVTDTSNVILDIDGYFAPPSSQTYQFYSLTPCRLVDTRQAEGELGGPRLQVQTPRDFPLLSSACIPSGLHPLAYSLNFTVVPNPSGQPLGYLTVWPTGDTQPVVSTLNNPTATVVANGAIVPAGTNGDIEVYAYNTTDLLIDINGYFAAPGTGGLSMYPAAPCRVLDTRQSGGSFVGERNVNVVGSACAPPSNAAAYVFNATVVPPSHMLYLSLWPNGEQQPVVSTLNAEDGFITSNMAIVPTTNGSIDAYAAALTQLILDISGYFAP